MNRAIPIPQDGVHDLGQALIMSYGYNLWWSGKNYKKNLEKVLYWSVKMFNFVHLECKVWRKKAEKQLQMVFVDS
jgi:hypothetical protein